MFSEKEKNDIIVAKHGIQDHINRAFQKIKDLDHDEGTAFQNWVIQNCAISGGITASLLNNEKVNDIDLYYRGDSLINFSNGLAHLFLLKNSRWRKFIKDINPEYMTTGEPDVKGKMVTVNAITLWNGMQIIRLDKIEESRKSFDFVHCCPMYDFKNLHISRAQYDSIKQKKLVINNARQITPYRVNKFEQRGWNRGGILV